jgi:2-polyprenyl-6-methoxyphenol hydroxylase-like FAD-dependent oxidoreductase
MTGCCIAGGGPAGMMLGLLLARYGVDVTLLEMHQDFERDFRGDTVHPSTLEILDQIGLAERVLQLPHTRLQTLAFQSAAGPVTAVDLSRLRTKFPFVAMLPQARLLDFLAQEAQRYPTFHLMLGATVTELLEHDGRVTGVGYRTVDGTGEVHAPLVVGADGRFSRVRHLAGLPAQATSVPMDVLWFRLPRLPGEPHGGMGRFGNGHILVLLDRGDQWQIAYVIAKGSYNDLREQGIQTLQASIAAIAPELAGRAGMLQDWHQVSLLSVESSRCPRWWRPGLLLIGDAAHVMSPIGGVGINYAVQDAVVAANTLADALKGGAVPDRLLARVQRRRELPTRAIQFIQSALQRLVIAGALEPARVTRPPWALRLPVLRDLPGQLLGFGLWPPQVSPALRKAAPPSK